MKQWKTGLWIFPLFMLLPAVGAAQETVAKRLWGNVVLCFPQNRYLYLKTDFEPKSQISGDHQWRNADVVPLIGYYPNGWVDLTFESVFGLTRQQRCSGFKFPI